MGKTNCKALLIGLVLLSGCATNNLPQLAPGICPQLPPAPADVMRPRQPTFLQRMEQMLNDSLPKPTKSPDS